MKALLLATILSALRAYVGGGLFQRIADMVHVMFNRTDLSGSQKMDLIIDSAKREAMTASETLIRAVVEVVLLKLKAS
jgi:hypothetical protein